MPCMKGKMYLLKASRMSEAYPSDRRPTLVACHSSATVWNVLLSCTSQTSFSYFFVVDGCKHTRFSSTHFLRSPGFQPSAGTLPASGYSGIHEAARCYIQPASAP